MKVQSTVIRGMLVYVGVLMHNRVTIKSNKVAAATTVLVNKLSSRYHTTKQVTYRISLVLYCISTTSVLNYVDREYVTNLFGENLRNNLSKGLLVQRSSVVCIKKHTPPLPMRFLWLLLNPENTLLPDHRWISIFLPYHPKIQTGVSNKLIS